MGRNASSESSEKRDYMIVFVLNKDKQPLDPTTEFKARKLITDGKAVIHKYKPFTIRLKHKVIPNTRSYRLKIDYGSRYTGLAILEGNNVVWLGELHHKQTIKSDIDSRRAIRRSRRNRKTRYRQARFLNRKRSVDKGWIPPTLESRVNNITNFIKKYRQLIPLTDISYELVKFDMQLMNNPDISGVEYQQGTLMGYEVREYLLEKFGRKCSYTGEENVPLEIEHVIPKSKGGTNSINNLVLATREVNQDKGNLSLDEWSEVLRKRKDKKSKIILSNIPKIKSQLKSSLKDAAIVNATRWKVFEKLKETGLNIEVGSGGLTKFNRTNLGLPKSHYYDACCVGKSTPGSLIFKTNDVLIIKAMGRGKRQMALVDKYGFPRGHRSNQKVKNGLMTGDFAKIVVPKGKGQGTHFARIDGAKNSGSIVFVSKGLTLEKSHKYVTKLQMQDGYKYDTLQRML